MIKVCPLKYFQMQMIGPHSISTDEDCFYLFFKFQYPTVVLPNEEEWTSFDSGLPTEILVNEDDWTSFDPFDISVCLLKYFQMN